MSTILPPRLSVCWTVFWSMRFTEAMVFEWPRQETKPESTFVFLKPPATSPVWRSALREDGYARLTRIGLSSRAGGWDEKESYAQVREREAAEDKTCRLAIHDSLRIAPRALRKITLQRGIRPENVHW